MATKLKTVDGTTNGSAKTAIKRKITAQPAAARASKPAAPVKKAALRKKATTTQISQELIALCAYFISENRMKTGEPGDSLSDWTEAERQLLTEIDK